MSKLFIYHANQCNPKKCTSLKMIRMNKAVLIKTPYKIPKNSIILNPYAEKALSPEDRSLVEKFGITALDCSWKEAEIMFRKFRFKNQRSLPFLIACNPINYGKPCMLSTIEAFIASLYITNFKEDALNLTSCFKWTETFIKVNYELLERYSNAKNSAEIIEIQNDYINYNLNNSKVRKCHSKKQ
ncbi:Protein of unknown function DUF367 [Methanocaldococcus vulcanius M7]|uniref:16S rRNA aminocarboxypropyltransferase n=1 Tax=Methanocaldococcus vulcanius (strain ATCC 700851 / DSM 12094 / M7) TaxID=579137 RepID=C9RIB6_METVM|nr:DUF367 family protein [Methanocaldococcus vulcanius]ACX73318.1 Protein of unknown function DUF367 [Methanocaldococcus vulcanius M7]